MDWKHDNGGNTTLVMTSDATFYVQRQGPMQNADGTWQRNEGVQLLMLVKDKGPGTVMMGTESWPNGQWRLLVANWSWPTMELSLDGGEFASFTVKTAPADGDFGELLIGADGGDPTLLDELTFYRRPLFAGRGATALRDPEAQGGRPMKARAWSLATCLVVLVLTLGAAKGTAVGERAAPQVTLPLMAATPTVDGLIDEAEWAGAVRNVGLCSQHEPVLGAREAVFWVGADDGPLPGPEDRAAAGGRLAVPCRARRRPRHHGRPPR